MAHVPPLRREDASGFEESIRLLGRRTRVGPIALLLAAVALVSCSHLPEAPYGSTYASPDGSTVARVEARRVSIDGRPSQHAFGGIGADGVVFSPDGLHSAYVGLRRGGAYLVVDDRIVAGPYRDYAPKTLALGADRRTSFFVARRGDDWIPVVDGREIGTFSDLQIGSPKLSANGKRIAFGVRRDSKWMVVDGTRVGPEVDGLLLGTPALSADGSHLAYGVERNGRWTMIVDDRPGPEFDELLPGGPIFSGNGSRMVYAARRGGRWFVVENDVPGPSFDEVRLSRAGMSADGARFAYAARRGNRWMVVDGDQVGPEHEALFGDTPVVSRDGKRLAYGAKRNGSWSIVADGLAGPEFGELDPGMPIFTPEANVLFYTARDRNVTYAVQNGLRTLAYDGILEPGFIVSADGRRVAYVRTRNGAYSVVVDGKEDPFYDRIGIRTARVDTWRMGAVSFFSSAMILAAPPVGIAVFAAQADFVDDGPLQTVVFCPDGSRYAYLADRGKGPVVVVDGVEYDIIPKYRKLTSFAFVDRGAIELGISGLKRPHRIKLPAVPAG